MYALTLNCGVRVLLKEKLNSSKTPQNNSKGENRVAKRKLYSPIAVTSDDEGKLCLELYISSSSSIDNNNNNISNTM